MTDKQAPPDPSRILIVEDEGLISLRIERMLIGLGYEVTGAVSSGEQALQSVEEHPPDLVLMDIKLAGDMDGVETAARIRARRDVPVVYLSAYPERLMREEIQRTQPYGFLAKPVRGQELGATVEMALYKHRMEIRLRESEGKYRLLAENVEDVIWQMNETLDRYTYVSPSVTRLLGYTPEEMMAMPVEAHLTPASRSQIQEAIDRRLAAEKGGRGDDDKRVWEVEYVRQDGSTVWVESRTRPLRDKDGTFRGLVGVTRDVSKCKRMENALYQQKTFLETLLETIPSPVFYKDMDGRYTGCNRAFEAFIGRDRHEIIGQSVYDMGPSDIADKYAEKDEELFREPGQQRYEWKVKGAEGQIHDVIFDKASIIGSQGQPEGLIGIITDITERKRAEKALRERVKELTCLYAVSRDVQKDLSTAELGQRTVKHLVPAMQFPEITVPVIELGGKRFTPDNYTQELSHHLHTEIVAQGEVCGHLWVYYAEERPFLIPEEQDLINGVADTFSTWLERKRARDRISFQAHLLDAVEQAVIVTNMDGLVVYWNTFAEQLYGWSAKEAIGRSTLDLIATEQSRQYGAEIMARLQAGQSWTGEYQARRRGGTFLLIRATITPIQDAQGELTHAIGISHDITECKQALEELQRIEWMLSKSIESAESPAEMYQPAYGDVTALNTSPIIMDAVGKSTLKQIAQDAIDLLDTSVAVYEKNGDYAFGLFSSAWCQFMDKASYKLCGDVDLRTALTCGKWLCHENCWNESAKAAIRSGHATDIECIGGIHLYAVPIFAGQDVIGVINIGYGNPPSDEASFAALAERFKVSVAELQAQAQAYEPRPPYIVALAKKRLHTIATLIGEIVERKRAEEALRQHAERLQILHEVDAAILAAQSPQEIAQAALLRLRDLVLCQRASVSEIDRRRQRGRDLVILTGQDVNVKTSAWYPLSGGGALIQALQAGDAHGVEDIAALEALSPLEQMLETRGLRSYVSVPLLAQGISLGSLNLASDTPGFFQPDHVEILKEIAASLAVAMQQAKLLAQTQRDAEIKALLLRDVNHRVMNNLDMILAILDLEMEQPRQDEREEALLRAVLQDISGRIQGMVAVHRILSSAQRDALDPGEVVSQVIYAALSGSPIQHHIAVTVNAADDLPRVSSKRAVALALIINELTTNSIKYAFADRSRGKILVQIERLDMGEEREWVRLVFQDDGPGWPDDVLAGEWHSMGLWLIQASATRTLDGQVTWRNDDGAVVEIQFLARSSV